MNSSESAEQVVKMSLQGSEIALKITGKATKELAIMLYAILNGNQKVKGKTTLTNMLKSGKELRVFSLKQEDLKKFTEEAKSYGILFSVLVNKKDRSPDGLVDLMVRAEDAHRINHIIDRFNLSMVDQASLKAELEAEKIANMVKEEKDKGVEVKTIDDKFIEEIESKPLQKDGVDIAPSSSTTEKNHPLENSSKSKKNLEGTKTEKPSVRKELKEIEQEQKESLSKAKEKTKEKKTSQPSKKGTKQVTKNNKRKEKSR